MNDAPPPARHAPLATPAASVSATMRRVLLALSPGIVAYTGFFGWGLLIQIALATTAALLLEALMLRLRGRPVAPFIADNSAMVTAWLLAICLPPLLPWWMTVLAVFFAVVIAKHLYGGLGMNPFNPAMVGYAVVLVSFPLEMTQWLPPDNQVIPGFADTVATIFGGVAVERLDGISAATPLDHFKHSIAVAPAIMGAIAGKGWEWVSLSWLGGGLWLVYTRAADWRIPAAVLGAVAVFAVCLSLFSDNPAWQNPLFHLLGGGTILAAFFIATDPVTAATTPAGRWIYGFAIGLLAMTIRVWGGYPDGFAFAVLLLNLAAPLIDYLTAPRAYGHQ